MPGVLGHCITWGGWQVRDLARIDRICNLLRDGWRTSPDLRLGQLVHHLIGCDSLAVFQVEDDVTERKLRALVDGGFEAARRAR